MIKQETKPFAIRVHEATHCAKDAHLVTYVIYGGEGKIKEGIAISFDQKYLDNC